MPHDKARIWFFTDIHGSNRCFDKFLRLPQNPNRPNVLLIGGDITGKQVVPLIEDINGNLSAPIAGIRTRFPGSALGVLKKRFSDLGYYPYECTEAAYADLTNPETFRDVFNRLAKERLDEWVKLADERLPPRDECQVIVNAGNDDPFFVDQVLDRSARLIRAEGKILDLPCGLKLVSTGYSNRTPWKCPRDESEEELASRIAAMTTKLNATELPHTIFNFHCPPLGSALDLADKIDKVTFQKEATFRGSAKEHVGSQAVRDAIERCQPAISLHGHIHEVRVKERIGRTICYNPGTDFSKGNLQGVFVQMNRSGEVEFDVLTDERESGREDVSMLERFLRIMPGFGPILDPSGSRHAEAMRKADHIIGLLNQGSAGGSGPPGPPTDNQKQSTS